MLRPYLVLVGVIAAMALAVPSGSPGRPAVMAAAQSAEIVFVDVAQGDAVVMRIGGQVIVSDAGEHNYEKVKDALAEVGPATGLTWRSSVTRTMTMLIVGVLMVIETRRAPA